MGIVMLFMWNSSDLAVWYVLRLLSLTNTNKISETKIQKTVLTEINKNDN